MRYFDRNLERLEMGVDVSRLILALMALLFAITGEASAEDREYVCKIGSSFDSISCTRTGNSEVVFQYPIPELAALSDAPALADASNASRRQLESYRKFAEKYRSNAVEGARRSIEGFRKKMEELLASGKLEAALYRSLIDLYADMIAKYYGTGIGAYQQAIATYRYSWPTADD